MKTLQQFLSETQEYSSAATSCRGKEVSALVKLYKSGMFDGAETALDYGAGKYARNSDWLRDKGIKTYAYDKFNGMEDINDGWVSGNVSPTLPHGAKFDVAFTTNVLNVVPEETEAEIISDVESRSFGKTFHLTRGNDIQNTVWNSVKPEGKRNEHMMGYVEEHYPEIHAKIVAGEATKADAKELAMRGVRTAQDSFLRIPDLTKYGYKRTGSGSSVVWTK